MTGEELYRRYFALQGHINNCLVDTWAQLFDDDRMVWDAMAEEINSDLDAAFEGYRE